jgi:hypothetical protein
MGSLMRGMLPKFRNEAPERRALEMSSGERS